MLSSELLAFYSGWFFVCLLFGWLLALVFIDVVVVVVGFFSLGRKKCPGYFKALIFPA